MKSTSHKFPRVPNQKLLHLPPTLQEDIHSQLIVHYLLLPQKFIHLDLPILKGLERVNAHCLENNKTAHVLPKDIQFNFRMRTEEKMPFGVTFFVHSPTPISVYSLFLFTDFEKDASRYRPTIQCGSCLYVCVFE